MDQIPATPFTRATDLRGAHWVRLEIVVQVSFIEDVHGKAAFSRLIGLGRQAPRATPCRGAP